MDFLCGWTLHEIVWPSSTLTHRTMYDCDRHSSVSLVLSGPPGSIWEKPRFFRRTTYLGVNLELLDTGHIGWRWSW